MNYNELIIGTYVKITHSGGKVGVIRSIDSRSVLVKLKDGIYRYYHPNQLVKATTKDILEFKLCR